MVALIRGAALAAMLAAGAATAELLDRGVVVVNDDIITEAELEQRLRIIAKQIEQAGTAVPPRRQLQAQVLEYMVVSRLQEQIARRRGVTVPVDMVRQEMLQLAQRNKMTPQQFEREVERSGIRYQAFVRYFYEQMLTQRLQQVESRRLVRVTEEEVDNFLRLQGELLRTGVRYRIGHILIALPSRAGAADVTQARQKAVALRSRIEAGERFASLAVAESDGRNALKGGDLGWRSAAELPEIAAEAITGMEAGEVTAPLRSPSGFHLFQLAAKEDGEQIMVRQTRPRHILIRTHAMMDATEAQARLRTLKRRAEAGEPFEELARAHSDDTASAVDGGDLGWRSPGELDPYFEERMERLPAQGISEPFETRFGWHIVQVLERREVDETEQTRRQRALNHLAQSRVNEAIEIWLRQLLEDSYVHYLVDFQDA